MANDSAMVIVAHPDDAEFLAGGATALWTRDGKEVIYVIVTNGEKGSEDPNITGEELATVRREEQQQAAASRVSSARPSAPCASMRAPAS